MGIYDKVITNAPKIAKPVADPRAHGAEPDATRTGPARSKAREGLMAGGKALSTRVSTGPGIAGMLAKTGTKLPGMASAPSRAAASALDNLKNLKVPDGKAMRASFSKHAPSLASSMSSGEGKGLSMEGLQEKTNAFMKQAQELVGLGGSGEKESGTVGEAGKKKPSIFSLISAQAKSFMASMHKTGTEGQAVALADGAKPSLSARLQGRIGSMQEKMQEGTLLSSMSDSMGKQFDKLSSGSFSKKLARFGDIASIVKDLRSSTSEPSPGTPAQQRLENTNKVLEELKTHPKFQQHGNPKLQEAVSQTQVSVQYFREMLDMFIALKQSMANTLAKRKPSSDKPVGEPAEEPPAAAAAAADHKPATPAAEEKPATAPLATPAQPTLEAEEEKTKPAATPPKKASVSFAPLPDMNAEIAEGTHEPKPSLKPLKSAMKQSAAGKAETAKPAENLMSELPFAGVGDGTMATAFEDKPAAPPQKGVSSGAPTPSQAEAGQDAFLPDLTKALQSVKDNNEPPRALSTPLSAATSPLSTGASTPGDAATAASSMEPTPVFTPPDDSTTTTAESSAAPTPERRDSSIKPSADSRASSIGSSPASSTGTSPSVSGAGAPARREPLAAGSTAVPAAPKKTPPPLPTRPKPTLSKPAAAAASAPQPAVKKQPPPVPFKPAHLDPRPDSNLSALAELPVAALDEEAISAEVKTGKRPALATQESAEEIANRQAALHICESIRSATEEVIDFAPKNSLTKILPASHRVLQQYHVPEKVENKHGGKSSSQYREEKNYPSKALDTRPAAFKFSDLRAHGTNLSSIVSALIHTNKQLVPGIKARKLGVKMNTGESAGESRLNQKFVSMAFVDNKSYGFREVQRYAEKASKIEDDDYGFLKESKLPSDTMPAIILGDGMEQGRVRSDIRGEEVYKRVNIRMLAVEGEHKNMALAILKHLDIDDVRVCTFEDLQSEKASDFEALWNGSANAPSAADPKVAPQGPLAEH